MQEKLVVIKEDGTEVEMTLLFTFNSEEFGFDYVLYYDEEDDEGNILAFRFDEETKKLDEIESQEEWEMVDKVLQAFLSEEE